MSATQHRRASDPRSLPRKLVVAIGDVVRLTNRGIKSLLSRRVEKAHLQVSPQSLMILRENILGGSKDSIIDVFGLPPRVQMADGTVVHSDDPFSSDTWYFPLDAARGTILVIEFDDDHAIDAQFVDAPQIHR